MVFFKYLYIILLIQSEIVKGNLIAAKCERLLESSCFGNTRNFSFTSIVLATDSKSQNESREKLRLWEPLKSVPVCWHVLEPFLCQVYLPKCENDSLLSPCRSSCLRVQGPCAVVQNFNGGKWPDVLNCERFPSSDCQELNLESFKKSKYNKSRCQHPLVETGYERNWYNGIEGCGLKCKNPLFTKDEHQQIHRFIAAFGSLSAIFTLFSVATFLIDWKKQSRYPAVIIFYMNGCFFLSSVGWLIQFIGKTHQKIVCRHDQSLRIGEPGSEAGYGWCLVTFFLVYYFSLAGTLWFVMLAYAWNVSFKSLGSTQSRLAGKTQYFHIASWMIPVTLTITILIFEEVDANSVTGICFVGYRNRRMKELFLLIPLGICILLGGICLIRGTYILYKVKGQNLSFLKGRASAKIRGTLIRIGLFTFFTFAFVLTTFTCHFYEREQQEIWENSLREFLKCEATRTLHQQQASRNNKSLSCAIKERPTVFIVQFQLFSLFGTGIVMSTWTWTKATLKTWKNAWIKFRGFDVKKRIQLSYHKRNNRKRISPLIQNALPAAVIVVPAASRAAMHRGSLTSNLSFNINKAGPRKCSLVSKRRSSKPALSLRLASVLSNWTSELSSTFRCRSLREKKNDTHKNHTEIKGSPLLIRMPEGRRGTLLSIESVLTTSSDGRLFLRRGSLQMSAASGSEHGRAFGHIRTVQPQLQQPSLPLNSSVPASSNLRVIRLGEEFLRPMSRCGPKLRMNKNRVLPLDIKSKTNPDNIEKQNMKNISLLSGELQQLRKRSPSRPNNEGTNEETSEINRKRNKKKMKTTANGGK